MADNDNYSDPFEALNTSDPLKDEREALSGLGTDRKLNLPRIIGHRGACGYAPENTLESIRTAAELGVEWVEFDVKLTSDGVPILFHDDTLDRTTSGFGPVKEHTLESIKSFDAGGWYADGFAGIGVPTLEEALDVILDYNLGINMEIKPCPGREIETAEAALDILSRIWDDHNRLVISSFNFACLEIAAESAPGWARGFLMDEIPEDLFKLAHHVKATSININGNNPEMNQDFIESLIDENFAVMAYTINDPHKARQLINMGVDSIFTDVPDVIAEEIITKH